jgi:hypothetical protein
MLTSTGREEKCVQNFYGKRDHLEDLGIGSEIDGMGDCSLGRPFGL